MRRAIVTTSILIALISKHSRRWIERIKDRLASSLRVLLASGYHSALCSFEETGSSRLSHTRVLGMHATFCKTPDACANERIGSEMRLSADEKQSTVRAMRAIGVDVTNDQVTGSLARLGLSVWQRQEP